MRRPAEKSERLRSTPLTRTVLIDSNLRTGRLHCLEMDSDIALIPMVVRAVTRTTPRAPDSLSVTREPHPLAPGCCNGREPLSDGGLVQRPHRHQCSSNSTTTVQTPQSWGRGDRRIGPRWRAAASLPVEGDRSMSTQENHHDHPSLATMARCIPCRRVTEYSCGPCPRSSGNVPITGDSRGGPTRPSADLRK